MQPTWKTLPLATLLIAVSGAIQGPPVALFFGWLLNIDWQDVYVRPELTTLLNCIPGAVYAIWGYLVAVLPLEYARPFLRRYSPAVLYVVTAAAAMFSSAAAQYSLGLLWKLGAARLVKSQVAVDRLALLSIVLTMIGMLVIMMMRTVVVETDNRERALAEAAALAKAHALQSQINPHFFFNTLTTVSALADMDSRAAKELIGQLAELFRYTLSCSRCEMVTLAEELEFVRNYLLIEQARFRRRLHFEMPARGAGAEVRLPGLTLQPVVENAIRHGISRRRDGGTVRIGLEYAGRGGGCWVISVANQLADFEDLPSFDEEKVFVPGHALANTRDRLALAFRGRATLHFIRDGNDWVKVALTVPASPDVL
ncbi:MAG: histidine kinase [Acidobacteriaceae bacterium]|nr:histidine kinase [Acidobacteriaceae bacterium]